MTTLPMGFSRPIQTIWNNYVDKPEADGYIQSAAKELSSK